LNFLTSEATSPKYQKLKTINVITPSSRFLQFCNFLKILSKADTERITFYSITFVHILINFLEFISNLYCPFLLQSEYSFDFTFHNHSCCLNISIICGGNSREMVRNSDMIHAIQSEDSRN
jgi:hypothetical protein